MALARAHVWNAGDILKAADLNNEFNNILNNPINLISPTTGPINFNGQLNTGLLPSAITASSATAGQVLQVGTTGNSIFANAAAPFLPSRVTNLRGFTSSGNATFSADSYVMRTTGGTASWTVTATSSFGVSVNTVGPAAGGRDQNPVFASTFVHFYAITTGNGSTAPAGLVSSNPPTVGPNAMPANYTGWTYLGGAQYSSASTTLSAMHFSGNRAVYDSVVANIALSGGTATSFTNVSYSSAIPVNAPVLMFRLITGAQTVSLSLDGASITYALQTSGDVYVQYVTATSGGLLYANGAAAGATSIQLVGYEMPVF